MNLYSCIIRLCDAQGLTLTEVEKADVSAAEIHLLQRIHGTERVVKIKHTGVMKAYDQDAELDRLKTFYTLVVDDGGQKVLLVEKLFSLRDLPETVRGVEHTVFPSEKVEKQKDKILPAASPPPKVDVNPNLFRDGML